jgi:hypothetical protein
MTPRALGAWAIAAQVLLLTGCDQPGDAACLEMTDRQQIEVIDDVIFRCVEANYSPQTAEAYEVTYSNERVLQCGHIATITRSPNRDVLGSTLTFRVDLTTNEVVGFDPFG